MWADGRRRERERGNYNSCLFGPPFPGSLIQGVFSPQTPFSRRRRRGWNYFPAYTYLQKRKKVFFFISRGFITAPGKAQGKYNKSCSCLRALNEIWNHLWSGRSCKGATTGRRFPQNKSAKKELRNGHWQKTRKEKNSDFFFFSRETNTWGVFSIILLSPLLLKLKRFLRCIAWPGSNFEKIQPWDKVPRFILVNWSH